MESKSVNPKLGQDQIAKELGCPSSTSQRYRHDINMLSPYRIPLNRHKRRQKILNTSFDDNSNREHDLKSPQMTSKDANENDKSVSTKVKTKIILRGGDPNNVNPSHGSILFEQSFSSPIFG